MKKLTTIILTLICAFSGLSLIAQAELKFGHIHIEKIIEVMPETDTAQKLLEHDSQSLGKMLEDMQIEYRNLLEIHQNNVDTYSQIIKKTKEAELIQLQDKIQEFRQNGSQQLQIRSNELFQPIYAKVQTAINKVATDEGITFVFDLSKGTVVFTSKDCIDINLLILKELGVE